MKFDARKVKAEDMGQYIELLMPTITTEEEALFWCEKAKNLKLRTQLGNFMWLPVLVEYHKNTGVLVGGGVTFPNGAEHPNTKAAAVEELLKIGVNTIDFSMNFQALLSGREDVVREELRLYASLAKGNAETKVIIEAPMLETEENIRRACELVMEYGFDWVKTATGVLPKVLTLDHVNTVLRTIEGSHTRCKVSGVKAPRAQNAYVFLTAGEELIGTKSVEEVIGGLDKLRAIGMLPAYEG